MHDLEGVQMPEARRNLTHGTFRIEGNRDLAELVRPLDDVCKRGWAQLKGDVKEARMCLLVIVPNDIWVVVRILEKADFAVGECNKVSKKTFYGHCTTLQGADIDNSTMRTVTCFTEHKFTAR